MANMDAVRCKFFDDDGNPIGTGCRFGNKCRYIHPTNPVWSTTMSYKGRRLSDRSRDDWQAPDPDSGYHRRNSSRGGSHSHTQRFGAGESADSGGWDSSSRTRKHSSTASWSKDSAWSANDSSNEPGPSTSRPPEASKRPSVDLLSGWGTEDTSESWGAPAKDSTDTSTSGWNADGWGEPTRDGTRGKGSGAAGSGRRWSSVGWGEHTAQQSPVTTGDTWLPSSLSRSVTNSPSVLSQTPAFVRSRESGAQPRASLDRWPASPRQSTDDVASAAVATTQRAVHDVEMKDDTQTSLSSTVAHAPRKPLPTRLRPPLPTRIITGPTSSIPVREATENKPSPLPPTPLQDWTKILLSGSITGRVKQDDVMSDASEPISRLATRDPKDLHAKLIKEMLSTVMIRYRLLKTEEKKTKWRDARASTCYHHSTPAAQKKLEITNHQYSEDLAKLNKQLNSSLKKVIQCSDALNAQRDLVAKGLDKKKVLRYTDELRDWIADLELPRRVFATKASIEKERDEKEAFRKRNREEVDVLKGAIYELELKATDIWDDFCHLQYVQPGRFKEEFIAAEKAMEEESFDPQPDLEKAFTQLNIGKDKIEVVRTRVGNVDERLNNHFPKVEQLREQVKSLENELVDLRLKDKEIKEFRQQAGVTIQQLEQWKTEDKERLDRLSQRIENLHKVPRHRSTELDDLTAYIDELVKEYVAKEIKPALDAIAEACKRDNRLVGAEFNTLLKQVVVKTYDLVQTALKANGLVPQIVSQPG